MSEKTFRTILFIAMLLVAPAILFLVQVVFIFPPVFFLAGLVFLLKKSVTSGFGMENLAFFAFFFIHLLIFSGLYWLIAWIFGKLASLIPQDLFRGIFLAALLAALGTLSQLPIYGGGGHGPAKFGPLQSLFVELEKSYGAGSTLTVYLTALGLVLGVAAWRWLKKAQS